jgi:ABC-type branched-subunit amino acid transport system ATPase component
MKTAATPNLTTNLIEHQMLVVMGICERLAMPDQFTL